MGGIIEGFHHFNVVNRYDFQLHWLISPGDPVGVMKMDYVKWRCASMALPMLSQTQSRVLLSISMVSTDGGQNSNTSDDIK